MIYYKKQNKSSKIKFKGKLGLALLSSQIQNQNQYRILLYVTKTQPVATIKIGHDFKLAIQKNNYASFYDENKQLWSVLFDSEDLVITFATQVNIFIFKFKINQ